MLRVGVVPILIFLPWAQGLHGSRFMAWAFIVAALTDWLDGWLARRDGGRDITRIGKLLDPLADKLLVSTALIMLLAVGRIPLWARWHGRRHRRPRAGRDRPARHRLVPRPCRRRYLAGQAQDRRAEHRHGRAALSLRDLRSARPRNWHDTSRHRDGTHPVVGVPLFRRLFRLAEAGRIGQIARSRRERQLTGTRARAAD